MEAIESQPGLDPSKPTRYIATNQTSNPELDRAIEKARNALHHYQHQDGYWSFELEADATIAAEYILMMHYMGDIDETLESKIAVYLRKHQCEDGCWNLYCGGDFDLSCTVKAYYALKLAGDDPEAPHMVKARKMILDQGGAAHTNVFTRYTLVLFGEIPWRGVPFLPVEIMLMPRWFPFHFNKVSYWSRTVMIPLSILYSLKPRAKNPRRIDVQELFTTPPEQEKDYFPFRSLMNRAFLVLERSGRLLEPFIPKWMRNRALKKAETWFIERLNEEHGLGGIFPAMVNALEALEVLGYSPDHPHRMNAKRALENLLVINEHSAYPQPCLSPIWDTALAALTLLEVGGGKVGSEVIKALDWLKDRQVLDEKGDWQRDRPNLRGGGWPFEFKNPQYPDLDDTAVVALAMYLADGNRYVETIARAVEWLSGMQSKNGGFAAFDVDNTKYYLNEIPFADHGALLDPPTSDVSARCVTLLASMNHNGPQPILEKSLEFLRREQEPDGSWFGRWGTNFIYGTWSALVALGEAGREEDKEHVKRAVRWLKQMQHPDGGWSEGNCSYCDLDARREWKSTSFQTAWALLGLLAAGEGNTPEIERGVAFLLHTQKDSGLWEDEAYTAPGFPRVFYLKYHGYDKYFPLWALARYRNLQSKSSA